MKSHMKSKKYHIAHVMVLFLAALPLSFFYHKLTFTYFFLIILSVDITFQVIARFLINEREDEEKK